MERNERQEVIDRIRNLIELNGSFTTADVQATSSPVINAVNRNHYILAERFHKDSCEGFEYVHEPETGSDDYEYNGLDLDTLYEILYLAEDWDTICYKTEKRCSN
jgi:hypothetical protein